MPDSLPRLLKLPAGRELYLKKVAELARKNRKLAPGLDQALRQRLWEMGFLAEVWGYYDFEHYAPGDYVSCLQRELTPFISGAGQVFLRDKLVFHKTFQDRLRVPELLAVAHPWRGDTLSESWHEMLAGPELQAIYCKPQLTGGGLGVFKALVGGGRIHLNERSFDQASFFALLHARAPKTGSSWYLITRGLEQDRAMSAFWPESINTVRLLCLREPRSQQRRVAGALLRVGSSRSGGLDNFTQGGTLWHVELASGKIGQGICRQPEGGWALIEAHPETGRRLSGEVLPQWKQVLELGLEAMRHLDFLSYVGWDVVIGPEGPALLEGNDYPNLTMHQVFAPLLLDPLVRSFYDFYGILEIKGPGHIQPQA